MNDWIHKFEKLNDREEILKWTESAPLESITEVLLMAPHSPKLSPLLMGLSTDYFRKIIFIDNTKINEVLNHEAHLEPIHYQLNSLYKILSQELNNLTKEQLSILKNINHLPIENITREDLGLLNDSIHLLKFKTDCLAEEINQALKLGWNTGRVEIIEPGSLLKEVVIRVRTQAIPSIETFLKSKLESVYGGSSDKPGLSDQDSIEDGLAKIGLWELEDFYKMGFDAYTHETLESIFQTLNKKGLKTVADLKAHSIYSKPLFSYFIADLRSVKT